MNFLKNKIFLYLFFPLFIITHKLIGQGKTFVTPDSTRVKKESTKTEIKGPIKYEAQEIDNFVDEKKTILVGKAKIVYQDMTLKAAKITINWETNLIRAEGLPDTIWVKKENGKDSTRVVQLRGTPEFSEAGDVMKGEVMTYNFKTRKGRVLRGRTAYEDGFYSGKILKMINPRILNVSDAEFTTCDREKNPHFHFWSEKMKICVNDKVIAKPLVMFIGHIPVLGIPFAYFPIRKGRHSGILIPRYGESSLEGRYLKGLGYYWAASDYWDVKGRIDYFEKSGFLFRGDLNYALRYKLRGTISGSWTRKNFDISGQKERRWDLSIHHSQIILPTMNLAVSGQFVSSGNFYRNLSANREQRLRQEIRSNARLTKKWGSSGKIEIAMNQTRNLNTDQISELIPQVTISNRVANLIPTPNGKEKEQGDRRWYHAITIPYQFNVLWKRSRQKQAGGSIIEKGGVGWNHLLGIYVSPTLFGWLKMRPSINYKSSWLDRRKEYYVDSKTNTIQSRDEKGFFILQTFNTSVSFSTKIYGLFRPHLLKNIMIRHVATPHLSFVYRPDFSDERYGYYQTVIDTQGVEYRKDRFCGSLFGSTPTGKSQSMNFGLNNVFQMKVGEGENEKKMELFTWNLSTSYNWKASQYKLSNLSSSFRASPLKNMSLTLRTIHSFYQVDEEGKTINRLYIDKITWKNWQSIFRTRWARLTYLTANINLRLKGNAKSKTTGKKARTNEQASSIENLKNLPGDRLDMDEGVTGFNIPWNLTATLSYTDNRYNPLHKSRTFWANTNLDFNLTKHWKISYRARWDLVKKEAVSQDFVFYRDLHCWEARIVWTPTGRYKRFYFRINIKSPMLREIKFEKGMGGRGLYGY